MTESTGLPDWARVKIAAAVGVTSPWLLTFAEKLGPVLDIGIKLGQVGVAAVTIVYIYSKWRKLRKDK